MTIEDKFNEPLTNLVNQEVDNWDVSVQVGIRHVGYEPIIKPFLQGMGVVVTQNAIDLYKAHAIQKSKNYHGMDLRDAVKEFSRDYILHHYAANDFNVKKTAQAIGLDKKCANPNSARVVLSQTAKSLGLDLQDAKNNPEKYFPKQSIEFDIDDQKVIDTIQNQIREYTKIVNPTLMNRLLTTYSTQIAERFAQLAKNIAQQTYTPQQ